MSTTIHLKFLQVEWLVCLVLLSGTVPSITAQHSCAEPSEKHLLNKLKHWGSNALQFIPGKEFNASHSLTFRIGEQSTSPWSYRINEDSARYPRKLMEAYCLHEGCIGADGEIDNSVSSMPYHTSIVVLRRMSKCKHKTYIYKKALEKFTLFCSCVIHTERKS